MLDWRADPQAPITLGTFPALAIVIGIDSIIFISPLVVEPGRTPREPAAEG